MSVSKIRVCLLGILYSHFVKKGCPGFENFMAEVPSLLNELKPITLFRLLVDFNTITSGGGKQKRFQIEGTTLYSILNAKLSQHKFWHCHENRLIKTIQTIPHNLYVSFKSAFLY